MRPKRHSFVSFPILRILLVSSMFLVFLIFSWSLDVLIIAPLSLTPHPGHSTVVSCASFCSPTSLDGFSFKSDAGAPPNMSPAGTKPDHNRPGDSVSSPVPVAAEPKLTWIADGPLSPAHAPDLTSTAPGRAPQMVPTIPGGVNTSPPAAGNPEDAATSGQLQRKPRYTYGLNAHAGPSKEEAEILAGVMDVMEQLRSSGAPTSDTVRQKGVPDLDSCQGRRVYIYDLPSKFNADIVANCDTIISWHRLCPFFSNSGLGEVRHDKPLLPTGRWFQTHQYALEVIFHARLRHYRCLTSDASLATLFYIPFYAGLDVLHWNFAINTTTQQRDQLSKELVQWLDKQRWWHRKGGRDHVLVLGKITWDFRRVDHSPSSWGSYLLKFPEMQNVTKLLIERDPWHENDIGVPHPTYFHPSSDDDIRVWQELALSSPRRSLVSFAGMPRPDDPANIRTRLIQQCHDKRNVTLCRVLSCDGYRCLKPGVTMKLFLNSHFCLQPEGDSPTRRSIFDSLVAGCIPVLFSPYSAYTQYPWHLPSNSSLYSLYIPRQEVLDGYVDVVTIVQQVPSAQVQDMRRRILLEIMPKLLYAQPGANLSAFQDAFDISLENTLNRAAKLEAAGLTVQNHPPQYPLS